MSKTYKEDIYEILCKGFCMKRRDVTKIIKEVTANHPDSSETVIYNAVLRTAYNRM